MLMAQCCVQRSVGQCKARFLPPITVCRAKQALLSHQSSRLQSQCDSIIWNTIRSVQVSRNAAERICTVISTLQNCGNAFQVLYGEVNRVSKPFAHQVLRNSTRSSSHQGTAPANGRHGWPEVQQHIQHQSQRAINTHSPAGLLAATAQRHSCSCRSGAAGSPAPEGCAGRRYMLRGSANRLMF